MNKWGFQFFKLKGWSSSGTGEIENLSRRSKCLGENNLKEDVSEFHLGLENISELSGVAIDDSI